MPEEPNEVILNTLNDFRELFYESNIPNIVFYNQGFSENIIRKAPDFWRYRGNYYEFKESEEGLTFEALVDLTTTYNDKEDLLRQKRINEYFLEKVKDKKEKSKIFGKLGLISDHLGELDKALEYYEDSLKLCVEMGIKNGMAINYGNMGNVYRIKGELDKALEYYEMALKLNEEMGRRIQIARTLKNIGDVIALKGEKKRASDYYLEAQNLVKGSSISESIAKRRRTLNEKDIAKS